MSELEKHTDPNKAPVWSNEVNQPYAKRTVSAIATAVILFLMLGLFVGWYFYDSDESEVMNTRQAEINMQMSSREHDDRTEHNVVYNFFYRLFSGAADGLETNRFNLENDAKIFANVNMYAEAVVENIDDGYRHSIYDVVGSNVLGSDGKDAGSVRDIIVDKGTGLAYAVIIHNDGNYYNRELAALRFRNIMKQDSDGDVQATVTEDTIETRREFDYDQLSESDNLISLRNLRNGQILDDQGNIAGQVEAIIYQNAEAQRIFFELTPSLTPGRAKEKIFGIPYEAVRIVQNPDGYDIQLTKAQTKALAESLFAQQ